MISITCGACRNTFNFDNKEAGDTFTIPAPLPANYFQIQLQWIKGIPRDEQKVHYCKACLRTVLIDILKENELANITVVGITI